MELREKLSNNSTRHSISKEQLQGGPLTKQDILETYADVFHQNWEVFQDYATSFPTQAKCKTH